MRSASRHAPHAAKRKLHVFSHVSTSESSLDHHHPSLEYFHSKASYFQSQGRSYSAGLGPLLRICTQVRFDHDHIVQGNKKNIKNIVCLFCARSFKRMPLGGFSHNSKSKEICFPEVDENRFAKRYRSCAI